MQLASYRQVLALPGVRSLLLVAMLARLPASAMALSLTLHVVLSLDLGYGAAGVVTATLTIGQALGGPLAGWATDRYGLRIVTSVTTVVSVLFFLTAPGCPTRRCSRADSSPACSPSRCTAPPASPWPPWCPRSCAGAPTPWTPCPWS